MVFQMLLKLVVIENGNGIIDNFSDVDGDGLSGNVERYRKRWTGNP